MAVRFHAHADGRDLTVHADVRKTAGPAQFLPAREEVHVLVRHSAPGTPRRSSRQWCRSRCRRGRPRTWRRN